MGLDRLEADRVMDAVRKQAEKVRGAREKVKEPGVEARKADASRRRFCKTKTAEAIWRLLPIDGLVNLWGDRLNHDALMMTV
ncbi:MAG: hypothetical protein R6V59_08695 [Dehalococcoidia bacterium]